MSQRSTRSMLICIVFALALTTATACNRTALLPAEQRAAVPIPTEVRNAEDDHEHAHEEASIEPAPLAEGERLRVVATTTLVGDAVRRVAGDLVELTVLMSPGSDPHAYVATPQDMTALDDAHLIFINGLGLEESFLPSLDNLSTQPPVVSVNEGVMTLTHEEEEDAPADEAHGGEGHHHHEGIDPHTWQDIANVMSWVETIAHALAERDPSNAEAYDAAADRYRQELAQLDQEVRAILAAIPEVERKLVTEHDNLRYFARAYGFTVVGSVIPSFSTMATLSAQEMAALQGQITSQGVRAIFVGSTVNPRLAEQAARDAGVQVVSLFTDSLSAPDGGAASYVEMMRVNANRIAEALKPR